MKTFQHILEEDEFATLEAERLRLLSKGYSEFNIYAVFSNHSEMAYEAIRIIYSHGEIASTLKWGTDTRMVWHLQTNTVTAPWISRVTERIFLEIGCNDGSI